MSDHILAMARVLHEYEGSHFDEAAALAWAAAVEASIAHKPCGGTGVYEGRWAAGEGDGWLYLGTDRWQCPGSHTTIVKGDGTKLYADRKFFTYDSSDIYRSYPISLLPLPSEWRIE